MLNYVFPRICSVCKTTLKENRLLCKHCLSEIALFEEVTFTKKNRLCYAGYKYSSHIKTLIKELKFNHKLAHCHILGTLISECMHEYYTHIPKLIIPIPLHKKRLQERGFNQALEVAKVIASTLQIAIEKHSIIRKKPTKPQAQLNALERKRNINNAFELKKPIQHDHIILFDDVITTGGTISECSRIIANSHIKQIDAWCIARAGD